MAKREHRLNRIAVENTLKKGRKYFIGGLFFVFLPNDKKTYRLAVVVAKKTEGSAIKRNVIKRKLRESFRLSTKKEGQGCDLVLIVRQKQYPLEKRGADLEKALRFINLHLFSLK